MIRRSHWFVAAAALALTAPALMAGPNHARVHYAGQPTAEYKVEQVRLRLGNSLKRIYVYHHHIEDRVVTAAKARQAPGEDYSLIEVRVTGTHFHLKPYGDYLHQGRYSPDANYHVQAAQDLAHSLRYRHATIVHGGRPGVTAGHSSVSLEPLFIMEAPKGVAPKKPIPSVPAPPQKSKRPLVAQAD